MNQYVREALAKGLAEGEAKGLAEGKAEGIDEGKNIGKAEIAINLLKENYPIEKIIKVTGLTEEEIEKLK